MPHIDIFDTRFGDSKDFITPLEILLVPHQIISLHTCVYLLLGPARYTVDVDFSVVIIFFLFSTFPALV